MINEPWMENTNIVMSYMIKTNKHVVKAMCLIQLHSHAVVCGLYD
jgi:hypothetical protein